jgi:hypothetical protein
MAIGKIIVGTVGGMRYLVCSTVRYTYNFDLSWTLTYNLKQYTRQVCIIFT